MTFIEKVFCKYIFKKKSKKPEGDVTKIKIKPPIYI